MLNKDELIEEIKIRKLERFNQRIDKWNNEQEIINNSN